MKSTKPWTDEVFTLCVITTVYYAVNIPRLYDCEFLNAYNLLQN